MAKIYRAPAGFEAPEIGAASDWQAREQAYIDRLTSEARRLRPENPLVGEVVRFPRADGYAQYLVWDTKPLSLIHLEIGDAWQIPDAHARGLRVSDIQQMVDRDRAWQKFLADRKSTAAA